MSVKGGKILSKIEKNVEELINPIVTKLGYKLYDVIYEKEAKDYYLRIFIDSENGISLEDCEKVNNAITEILDEKDYIAYKKGKYQYEVLTNDKSAIRSKYNISTIDKPSIEDIMLFYIKGEK